MKKTLFWKKILIAALLTLLPVDQTLAQLPSAPAPEKVEENALISQETGINYAPLQKLLAKQKWRDANEKTYQFFLKATGREIQGWIAQEQLKEFPCNDLRIMDQLWRKYSDNRFGFTVQFPIFLATGNRPGRLTTIEAYQDFGDRLGWHKGEDWIIFKENLDYSLSAPIGHLPAPRPEYLVTGGRLDYSNLAGRMVSCQLVSLPKAEKM